MCIYIQFHICAVLNCNILKIFTLCETTFRLYAECCTCPGCQFCCRKTANCIIFTFRLLQCDISISGIGHCHCLSIRCIFVAFRGGSEFHAVRTDRKIIYRLRLCHSKKYLNRIKLRSVQIFYIYFATIITRRKFQLRLNRKCGTLSRINDFCRKFSYYITVCFRLCQADSYISCIRHCNRYSIRCSVISLLQASEIFLRRICTYRYFFFGCCFYCYLRIYCYNGIFIFFC